MRVPTYDILYRMNLRDAKDMDASFRPSVYFYTQPLTRYLYASAYYKYARWTESGNAYTRIVADPLYRMRYGANPELPAQIYREVKAYSISRVKRNEIANVEVPEETGELIVNTLPGA